MTNDENHKGVRPDWSSSDIDLHADEAFDFSTSDFKSLIASSNVTIFQNTFWLKTLYQNLAPALDAKPLIISARCRKTNTLLMVLPLVRHRKLTLTLIQPADLGITDYNAVIGQKETLEKLSKNAAFISDLNTALKPFDLFLFRKQRRDTFDLARLFKNITVFANENAGHDVFLKQDFQTWRQATLSKSTRKGLARKQRNFNKEIAPLTFRRLTEPTDIKNAFVFLRRERAIRYPDDLLNRQAYFDFYLTIAQQEAESGSAITFIGEAEGKIITVDFGLYDGTNHIMLLGTFSSDEKYRKYSPSLLAILELIRHQKERGVSHFDFSIGNEEYKSSFGAKPIPLSNLALANSLMGYLALTIYRRGSYLKNILKKITPNIR